ncbi:MAG: hypothetical protein WCY91_09925 [Acidithiobacillus sp.]|jgi:hydroxyethylthiazole kinase-like sugar kinase family protein|uniref:Uncharacterized protein n=1 Tax=Acidithiobacillus ferruginosus TaxID=3063951 RepID=A0ACD5ILH8_9PROT|nr:hypothetical protein [Acidithiobacillus ferruginosus]MDD2746036.1 hypothetical protein [Acidithiobacillus ferrooxidans]MDD5003268.1 hypothetical protein [Acidithiobacillus sp.]MDD5377848.1 hypothetical protein [Acidithiobacillus sp.]MDD5577386.1 hypothetical protein [Acidithiobacillus sp.]
MGAAGSGSGAGAVTAGAAGGTTEPTLVAQADAVAAMQVANIVFENKAQFLCMTFSPTKIPEIFD